MTENANGPEPEGTESAQRAELGEPSQEEPEAADARAEQPRPDLDERERRLATVRKPMGPPTPRVDIPPEEAAEPSTEGPTDPS
jgi:hypothetical protein